MAKRCCRWYSELLRAGDPEVLTPMRARDFLFPAPVETDLGAHPVSCKRDTWAVPRVKRPGRGFDHPPPLVPRLKNEDSYTSTLSVSVCRVMG